MTTTADNQSIDDILYAQRLFFNSGKTKSHRFKIEALKKLEDVLTAKQDDILAALDQDLGKPGVEAYLAEYYFLLQELRLIRKSLKKWLKPRRVSSPVYFQPCTTRIVREPFGVTLVMAPWNYPIQLALSPLIAAVAAGNTVILKPSEVSSSCEALLGDIIREAFQPDHVAVVTGDAQVAGELLNKPFDFIFFTGSTAIGKVVAEKAAQNLTPCVMELGGKCPCIVDQSARVEPAARRILAGKFFNGGQTCFAPDFVVVHESLKSDLLKAFKTVMESAAWHQEMAHVINDKHYQRLEKLIVGEEINAGDDDRDNLRMAPRLLPDANWDDPVMQEEIFGPILPVLTYGTRDDLLEQLKNYDSPLALYVFGEDQTFIDQVLGKIRSGGVCINDTMKQGSQLHTPFGGVGDSGYGRYRGKAGVEALTYERTIVKRPSWAPEMFELMPPYGDKLNWLKRFLR